MSLTRKQEETRFLPVALSAEELADKALELAKAVQQEDEERRAFGEWEDGMKATKKAKQEMLVGLHMDTTDLAKIVEEGVEDRDVECDWLYSLEHKTAFLVRRDTGEKIDDRPLQPNELQTTIEDSFREPTAEELALWLGDAAEDESEGAAELDRFLDEVAAKTEAAGAKLGLDVKVRR